VDALIYLIFDYRNNCMDCSIWGEHADKIVSFYADHDNSSPAVLILQFCKTHKYLGISYFFSLYFLLISTHEIANNAHLLFNLLKLGAMGIANAFFGTKLILNGDLRDVVAYMAG
jgi:hypothetical protein